MLTKTLEVSNSVHQPSYHAENISHSEPPCHFGCDSSFHRAAQQIAGRILRLHLTSRHLVCTGTKVMMAHRPYESIHQAPPQETTASNHDADGDNSNHNADI